MASFSNGNNKLKKNKKARNWQNIVDANAEKCLYQGCQSISTPLAEPCAEKDGGG